MEKALERLARQLMGYDEASLASLWEKYAARVERFEPTRKWEEAALVFGMIQAMRWKNQLFNYHWKQSSEGAGFSPHGPELVSRPPMPRKEPQPPRGARILPFRDPGAADPDDD